MVPCEEGMLEGVIVASPAVVDISILEPDMFRVVCKLVELSPIVGVGLMVVVVLTVNSVEAGSLTVVVGVTVVCDEPAAVEKKQLKSSNQTNTNRRETYQTGPKGSYERVSAQHGGRRKLLGRIPHIRD